MFSTSRESVWSSLKNDFYIKEKIIINTGVAEPSIRVNLSHKIEGEDYALDE